MPRRSFMKTVCGFTGAMLAVNQATGMRFFDVSEAEAVEQAAAHEEERAAEIPPQLRRRPAHAHLLAPGRLLWPA